MKEVSYSVDIEASRQKVWQTLWQDKTFREWAGLIDPGTYMVGDLIEGNEVQFISAENGYGVTSFVDKLIADEYLKLLHSADTQGAGQDTREKQWTGGKEVYELHEHDGHTSLTVIFDVPEELEAMFNESYPRALSKLKELAEALNS